MPREQINYPSTAYSVSGAPGDPEGITYRDPELHVNWHNDGVTGQGFIQVSLNIDTVQLEHLSKRRDGKVSHQAIYTPVLTRSEVNKLIRVLRTARDKAYGRDE